MPLKINLKGRLTVLASVLAGPSASWAAGPTFQYHLACESQTRTRRVDLYLNPVGHPQFGYRYEGVGIWTALDDHEQRQFQADWGAVDGKSLTGLVHDPDGLGSWKLEILLTKWPSSPSQVRVIEYPESCDVPPCRVPLGYAMTCWDE
ncbi:MAG: hypothetical protein ABIR96_11240 [Bdellovibrionota bacterium]